MAQDLGGGLVLLCLVLCCLILWCLALCCIILCYVMLCCSDMDLQRLEERKHRTKAKLMKARSGDGSGSWWWSCVVLPCLVLLWCLVLCHVVLCSDMDLQ